MPIMQPQRVHKWVGAVAHQCVGMLQAHSVHGARPTSHGLAFPLQQWRSSSVSRLTETWIGKRRVKSEGWANKRRYRGVCLLLSRMSWRAAHYYLLKPFFRFVFFIDDFDLSKKTSAEHHKTNKSTFKRQPGKERDKTEKDSQEVEHMRRIATQTLTFMTSQRNGVIYYKTERKTPKHFWLWTTQVLL